MHLVPFRRDGESGLYFALAAKVIILRFRETRAASKLGAALFATMGFGS